MFPLRSINFHASSLFGGSGKLFLLLMLRFYHSIIVLCMIIYDLSHTGSISQGGLSLNHGVTLDHGLSFMECQV